jgi:hypothetical protein
MWEKAKSQPIGAGAYAGYHSKNRGDAFCSPKSGRRQGVHLKSIGLDYIKTEHRE